MAGTFDFCTGSRVITEMAPEEPNVVDMNGWSFTSKPKTPYRATFKVMLYGLRWYLNQAGTALDVTTNPTKNAGRLLAFYKSKRCNESFTLAHEYLGNILCRFDKPVNIPAAEMNSGGLIQPLEVTLIHHNPTW